MPRYKFNSRNEDSTRGTDGLEVIADTEEEARAKLLEDEATKTFEPILDLVSVSHDA